MHWLDALLIALLALGAVFGARTGLLRLLARLVGFGVALYTAVLVHESAVSFLQAQVMKDANPPLVSAVAYVLVFCVIYLAIFFGTLLIERGVYAMKLEVLNRLLGALLGTAQVGLLIGATFLGLASYPHPETQEMIGKSLIGPVLAGGVDKALVAMPSEYRAELDKGLEDLKASIKKQTEGKGKEK